MPTSRTSLRPRRPAVLLLTGGLLVGACTPAVVDQDASASGDGAAITVDQAAADAALDAATDRLPEGVVEHAAPDPLAAFRSPDVAAFPAPADLLAWAVTDTHTVLSYDGELAELTEATMARLRADGVTVPDAADPWSFTATTDELAFEGWAEDCTDAPDCEQPDLRGSLRLSVYTPTE